MARAIQSTNNENFGQTNDPYINKQVAKLGVTPTTQISKVVKGWQSLETYVAKKAYAAVFGYQSFPFFTSKNITVKYTNDIYGWDLLGHFGQVRTSPYETAVPTGTGQALACPVPTFCHVSIGSEIQADVTLVEETSGKDAPHGIGPYALAWRRLRRNKVALFFAFVFLVIVAMCLLAPVYSNDVAHIGPDTGNLTGQIRVGGKLEYILSLQGIPIGPTWHLGSYFLGADSNGRDVAVRLLYGGRSSLYIGVVGMLITMVFGTSPRDRLRLLPRLHRRSHQPLQ